MNERAVPVGAYDPVVVNVAKNATPPHTLLVRGHQGTCAAMGH